MYRHRGRQLKADDGIYFVWFELAVRCEGMFLERETQAMILGVVEERTIAFENGSSSQFVGEALTFALASSDLEICSNTIGNQPWSLDIASTPSE